MRRRRHELASAGFDDFGIGLGASRTGLRVPAATQSAGGTLFAPYLFLLAVVDLIPGDAIVGLGQYASLGAPQSQSEGGGAPFYPYEREIQSRCWHPQDGFITWILTYDSVPPSQQLSGPVDGDSFAFRDATSPALLYESAHLAGIDYLSLDAYSPPGIIGQNEITVRDLRFPFHQNSFRAMRRPIVSNTRVRFYAQLQQTTPVGAPHNARPALPFSLVGTPPVTSEAIAIALAPEDLYLTMFPTSAQYFAVAGRIIVDKRKPGRAEADEVM